MKASLKAQILLLYIGFLITGCNKKEDEKPLEKKTIANTQKEKEVGETKIPTSNTISSKGIVIDAVIHSSPDQSPFHNDIDDSYEKCSGEWTTNLEWGDCINIHRDKWQDLVKMYYDSLYQELDEKGKRVLAKSQTDWEKKIESDSDLFGYYEENTRYFGRETHFIAMTSEMYQIRDRAVELYTYLQILKEDKELKKDSK